MKKLLTLAMILSLSLLCSCKDVINEKLDEAKQNYQINQDEESALVLGEIYGMDYARKMEEAREGLLWFEEILEVYPHSQELRILQGNLYTLMGNLYFEDRDYTKALQAVEDGLRIMDKAVAADPENPFLLLYRGVNNATLPDLFDRWEIALQDLLHLVELGEEKTGEVNQIIALYNLVILYENLEMEDERREIETRLKSLYPSYKEVTGK